MSNERRVTDCDGTPSEGPPETESLLRAVAEGDRRALLEAALRRLAAELVNVSGRDVVVLVKELRSVIRELDTLPPGVGQEGPLDRLAAGISDDLAERRQRKDRRADAAGTAGS